MIDPSADRAVHRQLADLLREEIASGRLRPGDRLPAETRLAQEYGIGRDSVRAAIAILRTEGLVSTRAPYGSRVREPGTVTEIRVQRGSTWTVRMPTPEERRQLGIDEGVPVVEVANGAKRRVYPGDRHTFRSL